MKTVFLHTLSKAIHTYLYLDPESQQRLNKLRNKTMTITLLPFNMTFQCVFNGDGLHFQPGEIETANAKILGTPLQMLGATVVHTHRHRFFAEDLKIEGEAEFAQEVITLFDRMHIDWEDHFARWIGDVPAYRFNQLLKKTQSFLSNAEQSITQDIHDYIHEEAKWLPTREALQDFFADIDHIRMDIDRLEARIKHFHRISEAQREST